MSYKNNSEPGTSSAAPPHAPMRGQARINPGPASTFHLWEDFKTVEKTGGGSFPFCFYTNPLDSSNHLPVI